MAILIMLVFPLRYALLYDRMLGSILDILEKLDLSTKQVAEIAAGAFHAWLFHFILIFHTIYLLVLMHANIAELFSIFSFPYLCS